MNPLKIGIVEDDLLIAESIAVTLQQIGYSHTTSVRNYADALKMIETHSPDLLLIDIIIEGEKDGIELAATINKNYPRPFIFLTANSNAATVNRAKEVNPSAYLVKPFTESDLYSSIEIAFNNYNVHKPVAKQPAQKLSADYIFIKEGEVFYKLLLSDVLYVESDNVYLNIFTSTRRYLVRTKLDDFLSQSGNGLFIRVHRSFAVNMYRLENIHPLSVTVGGREVPLQKNYRQQLLNTMNTLK